MGRKGEFSGRLFDASRAIKRSLLVLCCSAILTTPELFEPDTLMLYPVCCPLFDINIGSPSIAEVEAEFIVSISDWERR